MAKIVIDVWSDYVCPFCYLQLPVMRELQENEPVEVWWHAYELRPEPAPTLEPQSEYLKRVWEGSVYPMAERQGLVMRLPPVQPRSRKALEAAEFARHKGKFEAMHRALFQAFFEHGRNISETSVLLEIAAGLGLNPVDLLGTLEAKEYVPKILTEEKLAHRLGIHAVPAMVFHFAQEPLESGYLVNGVQSVRELEAMIGRMKQLQTAGERGKRA